MITYPVPSGSRLPTRHATRQLVATNELAFIAARYRVKPGQRERPAEMIFMKTAEQPAGFFLPPYDALSHRDGDTYTIERQGGWPKDLELHAEEEGSLSPQLLPVGWHGMTHQLSLQFLLDGTADRFNRAGAGALGTPAVQLSVPDIVANRAALFSGITPGPSAGWEGAVPAVLQTLGALTVFMRVAPLPYWPFGSNPGFCVSVGDYSTGAPGGNHAWSLLVNKHGYGPNTLRYYASRGSDRSTILFDTTTMPSTPRSRECVISLRRNAAGTVVRLGIDSTFESSGTLQAPTGGTAGLLTFGDAAGSGTNTYMGKQADFNFAPAELSDAEVIEAVGIMLGR